MKKVENREIAEYHKEYLGKLVPRRCAWGKCGESLENGAFALDRIWVCEKHYEKADPEGYEELQAAKRESQRRKDYERSMRTDFGSRKEMDYLRPRSICV